MLAQEAVQHCLKSCQVQGSMLWIHSRVLLGAVVFSYIPTEGNATSNLQNMTPRVVVLLTLKDGQDDAFAKL
jgi:hypothetical protein